MKGGYFLYNGLFQKEAEAAFHLSDIKNRKSGFTEFFRAEENEVLFAETITGHLIQSAESIGIDLSATLDPDGRILRKDVSRLLNKNKLFLAAEIEFQAYTSDLQIHLQLQARESERGFYPLSEQGLLLSIYHDELDSIGTTPSYSASSEIRWMVAKRRNNLNAKFNLIVLNKAGFACESIGGSFALIRKDEVIFPSPNSGGYQCSILPQIRKSASLAGFQTNESSFLSTEDLLNAEEIFLFSADKGIRKVTGLLDQRYFNTKTIQIAEQLTRLARIDRSLIID